MKTRFVLSFCVLLLFVLLAVGSFGDMAAGFWILLLIVIVFVIVAEFILSNNKKKRAKLIKRDEESANGDFDRSISYGNDRCMFYFDPVKKQVLIMRITTKGIQKSIVDDFEFSGADYYRQNDSYFCIYDEKNRKLLCGDYKNNDVNFTNNDLSIEDKNNNIIFQDLMPVKIIGHEFRIGFVRGYIYTLIDECRGLLVIVKNGNVSSIINYISKFSISSNKRAESFINHTVIGNYNFIMDDFLNILIIVTPSSHEIFYYSDIIDVSYEEDSNQFYSRSGMRTATGAIVGGALMGGAGAIVGGLSGSTKKNIEVKVMAIKILLRNTQKSTCVLNFNNSDRILRLKSTIDKSAYDEYLKNANRAKDLLSIIIDKSQQKSTKDQVVSPIQQLSMADELAKLARLRSEGILTEEEFNAQKTKLLNS